MSDFSFKNKKFPIKFIPTFLVTVSVSSTMTFLSIIFLQDAKEFLDLKQYEVEEIEYEFQTLLENSSFDEIDLVLILRKRSVSFSLNLEVSKHFRQHLAN